MISQPTSEEYKLEKTEWIHLHGSESLRLGFIAGYSVDEGYLTERMGLEYPGFKCAIYVHRKVNTPSLEALNSCTAYKDSYCSIHDGRCYITIDNYLNGFQIVKEIPPASQIRSLADIIDNILNRNSPCDPFSRRIVYLTLSALTILPFILVMSKFSTVTIAYPNTPVSIEKLKISLPMTTDISFTN